jgi:hypothetical protein
MGASLAAEESRPHHPWRPAPCRGGVPAALLLGASPVALGPAASAPLLGDGRAAPRAKPWLRGTGGGVLPGPSEESPATRTAAASRPPLPLPPGLLPHRAQSGSPIGSARRTTRILDREERRRRRPRILEGGWLAADPRAPDLEREGRGGGGGFAGWEGG